MCKNTIDQKTRDVWKDSKSINVRQTGSIGLTGYKYVIARTQLIILE